MLEFKRGQALAGRKEDMFGLDEEQTSGMFTIAASVMLCVVLYYAPEYHPKYPRLDELEERLMKAEIRLKELEANTRLNGLVVGILCRHAGIIDSDTESDCDGEHDTDVHGAELRCLADRDAVAFSAEPLGERVHRRRNARAGAAGGRCGARKECGPSTGGGRAAEAGGVAADHAGAFDVPRGERGGHAGPVPVP